MLQGCGFKTRPQPMPDQIPPKYFSEPISTYRDTRLRIEWEINDVANVFFEKHSISFQKKDSIRRQDTTIPHSSDSDEVPGLLIEEYYGQDNCPDCEDGWLRLEFIPLTSSRFLREGSRLFLYDPGIADTQTPKIRQIRLSWQEDEELLQQMTLMGIPPKPVFPEPVALMVERISDIEGNDSEDSRIYIEEIYDFGKILRPLNDEISDSGRESDNNPDRSLASVDQAVQLEGNLKPNQPKAIRHRYSFRFSWPAAREGFYQRFPQPGEIVHKTRFYGANLYQLDSLGTLPEIPLNKTPLQENHYLFQKDVLTNLPGPSLYEADSHPGVLPRQALFYIDLAAEKEDILLFQLRLVDRLGNEGPSSLPTVISLPRLIIAEKNWSSKGISPFTH